jgi:hypothetical protein
MALDLIKNDPAALAETGYTFTLCLPDGSETDAKLTVRGVNSPAVKNYSRKVYQEFKTREQAAKRRGRDPEELSLEDAEELAVNSAAVRLIGWEGIEENGKPVKFEKEEVKRILTQYPFIRENVMKESDEILNFRPKGN